MKRKVSKGGEPTNALLTDEMIEKANDIVNSKISGTEDTERVCCVWDANYFPNLFTIFCRTTSDYQDYKFRIVDGDIKYIGMEGNWREK